MEKATNRYREQLPGSPAEDYLATRGLSTPTIHQRFGLGYVEDPVTGHDQYRGMLAIPYLRWTKRRGWSTVSIRFRRLGESGPKYQTRAGDRPRLYNTPAMLRYSPEIAITEGEFDSITAQEALGFPAVGVPGVESWQKHFIPLFLGYRSVFVLADGDEPGMKFANTVAGSLPNARVVPMPASEDVNSFVQKHGAQALIERLKR